MTEFMSAHGFSRIRITPAGGAVRLCVGVETLDLSRPEGASAAAASWWAVYSIRLMD